MGKISLYFFVNLGPRRISFFLSLINSPYGLKFVMNSKTAEFISLQK